MWDRHWFIIILFCYSKILSYYISCDFLNSSSADWTRFFLFVELSCTLITGHHMGNPSMNQTSVFWFITAETAKRWLVWGVFWVRIVSWLGCRICSGLRSAFRFRYIRVMAKIVVFSLSWIWTFGQFFFSFLITGSTILNVGLGWL